jgi:hypothetical protein
MKRLSLRREQIDAELATRVEFWKWMPPADREAYLRAQDEGDRTALRKLEKRGRRRLRFETEQVCGHAGFYMRRWKGEGLEAKWAFDPGGSATEQVWVDPSDYGEKWPDDYRPGCRCLERVLDSDRLMPFVTSRADLEKLADRLHENPRCSIRRLIDERRREAKERERQLALREQAAIHRELEALERTSVSDVAADQPESSERAAEPPIAQEDDRQEPLIPDEWLWRSQRTRSPLDGIFGSDGLG